MLTDVVRRQTRFAAVPGSGLGIDSAFFQASQHETQTNMQSDDHHKKVFHVYCIFVYFIYIYYFIEHDNVAALKLT